jgi:hypothetical protein
MEKKRKERRKRRKQELLVFVKTCLFGKIKKMKNSSFIRKFQLSTFFNKFSLFKNSVINS